MVFFIKCTLLSQYFDTSVSTEPKQFFLTVRAYETVVDVPVFSTKHIQVGTVRAYPWQHVFY